MPTTRPSLVATLVAGTLASAALALTACNIAGPAAYLILGPEKVDAQYVIPKQSSVVIFIDDRRSLLPDRSLRKRIARAAEAVILEDKQEIDLIASDSILELATRDRFTRPQGIVEMGEAVGAKFVIYATIDGFTLAPDGTTHQPTALVRMKVIDVPAKARVWPAEPDEWKAISTVEKPQASTLPNTSTDVLRANQRLADKIGRVIGLVFVKHEPDRDSRVGETLP